MRKGGRNDGAEKDPARPAEEIVAEPVVTIDPDDPW